MVQFLLKLLLKQRILSVNHDFHWLLVATKFLAVTLRAPYVKESQSEILDASSRSRTYLRLATLDVTAGTFLELVCQAIGCPGWHLRNPQTRAGLMPTSHQWEKKLATPFRLCSNSRLLAAAQTSRLTPSGDVVLQLQSTCCWQLNSPAYKLGSEKNGTRPCFLLRTDPASEKLEIT